jgi:hypothetical protein
MHDNWKIHKRLLDAGGLGPVVYHIPPRNGFLYDDIFTIERLVSTGRTVVYGRPGGKRSIFSPDYRENAFAEFTWDRYKRAEMIFHEFWKGESL